MKQNYIRFIFSLILVTLASTTLKSQQSTKFEKVVVADGLTSINTLLVDKTGFVWFGGNHGLYRFDGVQFRSYHHNPDDSNTLSFDNVISLYEDSNQDIWVGTENNGLNIYRSDTERIERVVFQDATLNTSSVSTVFEDHKGQLWIGTKGNGIYVVDTEFHLIARYFYDPNKPNSLSDNTVFEIISNSKNEIWVATNGGSLDRFNDGAFIKYPYSGNQLVAVRTGQQLLEDNKGRVWLGTEGNGLHIFDPEKEAFLDFDWNLDNPISNKKVITDLGMDSNGNIWVSTDGGGVSYFDDASQKFAHFYYNQNDDFGISNNSSYSLAIDKNDRVWLGMGDGSVNVSKKTPFDFITTKQGLSMDIVVDIALDSKETLWAGTGGGGLDYILSSDKSKVYNYNTQNGFSSDVILTIHEDEKNNIWAGTFLGGVNRVSPSSRIDFFNQKSGLSNDHIFDVVSDRSGRIWLATQGSGLDMYDPKTDTNHNWSTLNGLISDRIQCLMVDENQKLWIGFYLGGIQVFDVSETPVYYNSLLLDTLNHAIGEYPIHDIHESTKGTIWLSTGGAGLVKVNSKGHTIYTTRDGLPSNSIYGSKAMGKDIWASSNKGIFILDTLQIASTIYTTDNGLITNDYESGSIVSANDGKMYFGSKKGILHFYPNDLKSTTEYIDIVFTDLKMFGKRIIPQKKYEDIEVLSQSIVSSKQITIPYELNNFTIDFSCPTCLSPENVSYRYKLIGFSDDWITLDKEQRSVQFSNLKELTYELLVQGYSGQDNFSVEKSILVKVNPPFFKSNIAYFGYFILAVITIILLAMIIRFRVKLRNQLKFEKYSREKDNEFNKNRIDFFTNISHELRTPLTLILGSAEQLSENHKIDNRVRRRVMLIQKNSGKLLSLINQLLDFRKMESGNMKIQVSQQDIVLFVEEILLTFRELSLQKGLNLTFINNVTSRTAFFDESKLEIILYNLLSNAIKFTEKEGHIIVDLSHNPSRHDGQLIIKIEDTGIGIAENSLEQIFDPFYRATKHASIKGTGIGLALVKNVVNLHHGTIKVKSRQGSGSTFTVCIPAMVDHYDTSEIREHHKDYLINNTEPLPLENLESAAPADEEVPEERDKMLIVEDNLEIKEFISDSFSAYYQISTAKDGHDGLQKAMESIPDIIISDIMMPNMDGIEMCRHLKHDVRTSHIPIILLTARSGFTHELSGLDTGADDYVSKPFSIHLLKARVENLIANRERFREKIKKEIILEPSKIAVSNPDEYFLKEVMECIEQNISDSEYTVKQLAIDIGLSHSVLYRKIQALTKMTINDLIKSVRLKRAAELLKSKAYNISDVSYMVGFSNPKYFSTCFKSEFGMSPSEV